MPSFFYNMHFRSLRIKVRFLNTILTLCFVFQVLSCNASKIINQGNIIKVPDSIEVQSPALFPSLQIDLGGETFYTYGLDSRKGMLGLAAIMVDINGEISHNLSFFSAFHFDSSPWQNFLNIPSNERAQAEHESAIDLEVEEFFATWSPVEGKLSLSFGRMFSLLSYANQLHGSDFQFSMKPRVFTQFWGNNHGLGLDGIRLNYQQQLGTLKTSLVLEGTKNGFASELLMLTSVLDMIWNSSSIDLGIRGFTYFDHQKPNHPLLKWMPAEGYNMELLEEGLGFNGWGTGINGLWHGLSTPRLFFQGEFLSRKVGQDFLRGGYVFVEVPFSNRLSSSIMYQKLEIPVDQTIKTTESGTTLGISYIPLAGHRVRMEYSHFSNSTFYKNMVLAKWTFQISL